MACSEAARLSAGRWQLRPTLNLSYKPEGPFEAETEIVPLRLSFSNVLLADARQLDRRLALKALESH